MCGGKKRKGDRSMSLEISMKTLLESGVHFGHRTNRWDPRMKPFIFTERNGIHIIDLQQTVQELEKAYSIIRSKVAEGGTILFVGTKRQAQETIQMEAERCGMPYVIERWLPGTLTNWMTIHQRIMELERLEKLRDSGEIDRLVKKEGLMIERKIKRLLIHLSGIRYLSGVPDMIFVVDITREDTAVHEANLKKIPVVALVDTNCNPENIDHLIPCNDDAIRAIKLMAMKIADAVIEGKDMRKEEEEIKAKESAPEGEQERSRVFKEEEIDDEDLLGEATLQKLADRRREAEEKAAEEAAAEISEGVAVEEVSIDIEKEPVQEPPIKPVEEPAEKVAEESDKEAVEKPVKKTVRKPAKKPVEEPAEKAAEESDKEAVEKPVKKTVRKPAKKPVEKSAEKAAEKPAKKTAGKAAKKPAEESAEKAAEKTVKKPARKTAKKSTKKPAEDAADKPVKKPAKKSAKKSVKKSTAEAVEEVPEKSDSKDKTK